MSDDERDELAEKAEFLRAKYAGIIDAIDKLTSLTGEYEPPGLARAIADAEIGVEAVVQCRWKAVEELVNALPRDAFDKLYLAEEDTSPGLMTLKTVYARLTATLVNLFRRWEIPRNPRTPGTSVEWAMRKGKVLSACDPERRWKPLVVPSVTPEEYETLLWARKMLALVWGGLGCHLDAPDKDDEGEEQELLSLEGPNAPSRPPVVWPLPYPSENWPLPPGHPGNWIRCSQNEVAHVEDLEHGYTGLLDKLQNDGVLRYRRATTKGSKRHQFEVQYHKPEDHIKNQQFIKEDRKRKPAGGGEGRPDRAKSVQ